MQLANWSANVETYENVVNVYLKYNDLLAITWFFLIGLAFHTKYL